MTDTFTEFLPFLANFKTGENKTNSPRPIHQYMCYRWPSKTHGPSSRCDHARIVVHCNDPQLVWFFRKLLEWLLSECNCKTTARF